MRVICPKCGAGISGDQVNVAADVARCVRCDELFPLSSLVEWNASGPVDLENPPPGAWYRTDFDGFEVGATTRSAVAFFLVPFLCVWSGGSLGGIYGTQIVQGRFNLLFSLFGIPFALGTLLSGHYAPGTKLETQAQPDRNRENPSFPSFSSVRLNIKL